MSQAQNVNAIFLMSEMEKCVNFNQHFENYLCGGNVGDIYAAFGERVHHVKNKSNGQSVPCDELALGHRAGWEKLAF